MKIRFYYNFTNWRLKAAKAHREWLERVISLENAIIVDVKIIFTNDDLLREINREFLNHDYYTDVITFSYGSNSDLEGEIYISTDTVKINAGLNNVSKSEEFRRVMVHGILHMCGMNDDTEVLRLNMRERENKYLKLYDYEF